MKPEWVERIFTQCNNAGVRFFFKQWGGIQKKKTGRLLHDRTYDEMPQIIRKEFPSNKKQRISLADTLMRTSVVKHPYDFGL
jgi:hypothetical protein